MTRRFVLVLTAAHLSLGQGVLPPSGTVATSPLTRHYQDGERVVYRMTASNQDRTRTTVYAATARGTVKRNQAGTFFEEYEWSDIVWNGSHFALPEANRGFRQLLSLDPAYTPALPDFSKLHPRLVGPTTDLMTFYADAWLAIRQPGLRQPGDRVHVAHGDANSWADGRRVIVGEDSIDFDIAFGGLSTESGARELRVQHVPPSQPKIRIPAEWMRAPVADSANNWVQVLRLEERRYVASVGKETFDALIRLSPVSGAIVSADMENPVEVLERECQDEALTQCGDAVRYRIMRRIQIVALPE